MLKIIFNITCLLLLGFFQGKGQDTGPYIVRYGPENIDTAVSYSNITGKGLLFYNLYFELPAKFETSDFTRMVKMREIEFNGGASFETSSFKDSAVFVGLNIHGDLSFNEAVFSKYASFSDLDFEEGAQLTFNRARLPDTLIFDYNSPTPVIDFTESLFDSGRVCKISLMKTDISKLRLDYTHFKLCWINYGGSAMKTEEKESVYEGLLNNFKANGQSESYKSLDIEYSDFKWKNRKLKWISRISELWWNYGYNKEYIFKWTFYFVLFFTVLTFFMLDYLNDKVYTMKNISAGPKLSKLFAAPQQFASAQAAKRIIQNFFSRAWYSFVYTSSLFFRLTLKIEDIQFERVPGAIYIMIIYTIGLVCIAYMANFVLQK